MKQRCPNCGKVYTPKYESADKAPEGTIYKEQHQTGICSDECWDEWLGVDL